MYLVREQGQTVAIVVILHLFSVILCLIVVFLHLFANLFIYILPANVKTITGAY